MRIVCRSEPLFTGGTTADCAKAKELIQGMETEAIIADKDYGTNAMMKGASDIMEAARQPTATCNALMINIHNKLMYLVEIEFL